MATGVALTLSGAAMLLSGTALITNYRGIGAKVAHAAALMAALFGDRSRLKHERGIALFYGFVLLVCAAGFLAAGAERI